MQYLCASVAVTALAWNIATEKARHRIVAKAVGFDSVGVFTYRNDMIVAFEQCQGPLAFPRGNVAAIDVFYGAVEHVRSMRHRPFLVEVAASTAVRAMLEDTGVYPSNDQMIRLSAFNNHPVTWFACNTLPYLDARANFTDYVELAAMTADVASKFKDNDRRHFQGLKEQVNQLHKGWIN